MKKITLLFTLLISTVSFAQEQVTITFVSTPTELVYVDQTSGSTDTQLVIADGSDPLVIRVENISYANDGSGVYTGGTPCHPLFDAPTTAPRRALACIIGNFNYNSNTQESAWSDNPNVAVDVIPRKDEQGNLTGRFDFELVYVGFDSDLTGAGDADNYFTARMFGSGDGNVDTVAPITTSILARGTGTPSSITLEQAKAAAATASTLSTVEYKADLTNAFYRSSTNEIVISDNIDGKYSIYNMIGQVVLKGEISNRINVETLKNGMYILSTNRGKMKFIR